MTYSKYIREKKLYVFKNDLGGVLKFLNAEDKFFNKFGEIYFSSINKNKIKCWKLHKKMTMNICVPLGNVKFVFKLDSEDKFYTLEIGSNNFKILNVKPGIWFGFQGLKQNNLVCNLSDIIHDDNEVIKKDINSIKFNNWSL